MNPYREESLRTLAKTYRKLGENYLAKAEKFEKALNLGSDRIKIGDDE